MVGCLRTGGTASGAGRGIAGVGPDEYIGRPGTSVESGVGANGLDPVDGWMTKTKLVFSPSFTMALF